MNDKFEQAAFPTYARYGSPSKNLGLDIAESGMTLRDYFAAKAMQSLSVTYTDFMGEAGWENDLAGKAYRIANAMMEAREAEELK